MAEGAAGRLTRQGSWRGIRGSRDLMDLESRVPLSVLIAVRNEVRNLRRCMEPLAGWADEVVVVDSQSTDGTVTLAEAAGAVVLQFKYGGGWPKKREWALRTHSWRNDWILVLDADEILTEPLKHEIREAICTTDRAGYWLSFQMVFLGRMLRHGDTELRKLSLFRRERGHYERRLLEQDLSMSDVEVHEHVVVDGRVGRIKNPGRHENWNSLDRYIAKHNEYSNWEASVFLDGSSDELRPSLTGNQAQRRRWLKQKFLMLPGSPLWWFLHGYVIHFGFLDGRAGFVYATFRFVHTFQVKAKIVEQSMRRKPFQSRDTPHA